METKPPRSGSGDLSSTGITKEQFSQLMSILTQIRDQKIIATQSYPGPGELHVKWCESFTTATIGISTLGASVTFVTIVSQLQDPNHLSPSDPSRLTPTVFQRETIRAFLSIAWLMFVVALGIASFAAMLLNFHRDAIQRGFGNKVRKMQAVGLGMSFVLELLLFGAFFFLSLCLVAYSSVVGWVAVAFSGVFAIAGLAFWVAKIFSPLF